MWVTWVLIEGSVTDVHDRIREKKLIFGLCLSFSHAHMLSVSVSLSLPLYLCLSLSVCLSLSLSHTHTTHTHAHIHTHTNWFDKYVLRRVSVEVPTNTLADLINMSSDNTWLPSLGCTLYADLFIPTVGCADIFSQAVTILCCTVHSQWKCSDLILRCYTVYLKTGLSFS